MKTEKGQACGTASGVPRIVGGCLPRGPDDTAFASSSASSFLGEHRASPQGKLSKRQLVRLDRWAKCNDALRVAGRGDPHAQMRSRETWRRAACSTDEGLDVDGELTLPPGRS